MAVVTTTAEEREVMVVTSGGNDAHTSSRAPWKDINKVGYIISRPMKHKYCTV